MRPLRVYGASSAAASAAGRFRESEIFTTPARPVLIVQCTCTGRGTSLSERRERL